MLKHGGGLVTTGKATAAVFVLVRFCTWISLQHPHFDLEPDYIIRKPPLRRTTWYILRREILSTFHTGVNGKRGTI